MKQSIFIFLLLIVGLGSSANQNNNIPFTSSRPPSSYSSEPGISKIIDFRYSIQNNRVLLSWIVKSNEDSNQFEIEKSKDGKTFTVVALVFGTDKPDTDNYTFYEKFASVKTYYRIKILHKNETISYSDTIVAKADQ